MWAVGAVGAAKQNNVLSDAMPTSTDIQKHKQSHIANHGCKNTSSTIIGLKNNSKFVQVPHFCGIMNHKGKERGY